MKTISDALAIRRRVFGAFELAETASSDEERAQWLTFALVGGGPTGVELAGQIRELATQTLHEEFRTIRPEDARVLLFDGGDAPLKAFGPKLAGKAADTLERLGVELHMGCAGHVGRRGRAAGHRGRPGRALRRADRAVDRRRRGAAARGRGSPRPPVRSTTGRDASPCAPTARSRGTRRSSSSAT